jgi:hypothetical protein
MKNHYQELRDRQQEEVNAFPMFFAFDQRQFAEGMRRLGLRPSDMNQVYAIAGTGGFYRKSDAPKLHEMFARHRKELEEAIAADKAGDNFIYEMFLTELSNHEYGYRQGPITFPYEKYGSTHPIQLKVSAYMDGNLAIAMHTWENGYAEPWASLTVNLDGERGKDCAFIDTNGDADFPVWLIRHGLAIPTGATQRSGYCEYPEYRFRADRLRELDPEGYAEYLSLQEGRRSA